ncbi:glycosyltransferase family 2 protein [Geobacter sp. FeAm09]|uniref:glycosyltransferase family 2 protein n=1 Tax=Geobacter sp. FeAm09 TaxID=2597769 RepID=UPI0011EECC03|nr:glycosyltransferase family 2 protein [Geobacter sp. FeAm09]QEM66789.1 glycosyltransferase family 2 protein [Geobacter sp. FeAm09]
MRLSIVMPCLNEALTLPTCIGRAKELLERHHIDGEVVVSDNGSTDGSQKIAEELGARVVICPVRGYGAALQYGIEQARGDYVIMGDSDDSYHFDEAYPMLQKLEEGYDVCMGTRLKGTIMPGAMPTLNRVLGNPILTFIGRLFFNIETSDFHCGMRAFRRDKVLGIGLVTTGMEWASEQVIKSRLNSLKMTEVPITLYKDGRNRPPHLRRWRDGWRHLRFMLLHAPNWLFIYPGMALVLTALALGIMLLLDAVRIGPAVLDVHSLLTMSFMTIVGIQTIFAGLFANLYAHLIGILPTDTAFIKQLKRFSLEKLLVVFGAIGLAGIIIFSISFWGWYAAGYPALDVRVTMRHVIPALTLITIAGQGIFNCFMFSMLFLKTKNPIGSGINDHLE